MTITTSILPEEIDILKRMAAEFDLQVYFHEPTEDVTRRVTIDGILDAKYAFNIGCILTERKHYYWMEKQLNR